MSTVASAPRLAPAAAQALAAGFFGLAGEVAALPSAGRNPSASSGNYRETGYLFSDFRARV
jgi:hypothetical protein